ncbi:MAG: acetate--CoA ligase family protein [Nanoarchaeota archaeon]
MALMHFTEWTLLLTKYDIPFGACGFAKTTQEALKIAKHIKYPVVLKAMSPKIIHKSDTGFVMLDIKNESGLKTAYDYLVSHAKGIPLQGMLVQKMAKGKEVIIGMKNDPTFGPVIMFGHGGIFVEVLKDVTFRVLPLTRKDAKEMIEETKGYSILAGARGEKRVNIAHLEKIIMQLAKLAKEHPEIKEIDFNPVIVDEKHAIVVDTRILT